MKRRHVIVIALVSAVSAAGFTAAVVPGALHVVTAAEASERGWHWAHWGGRHDWGRGGHGDGHFCGRASREHIDEMLRIVEDAVNFTPEQLDAWRAFGGDVREATATIRKVCDDVSNAGEAKPAPKRLAHLESAVASGLDTIKRLRPSFERFYATLSDKQRRAVDDLFSRRHGH